MNDLQCIDLKIFAAEGGDVPPTDFVPVLQRWIQEHAIDGVLIDVADYSHMHHGAGIILVGHERNFSLDYADGRMGLLVKQRHPLDGSLEERLTQILRYALTACALLEEDPAFAGKLSFDAGALQITANDRLFTQENAHGAELFYSAVSAWAREILGDAATIEQKAADPRDRAAVEVRVGAPVGAKSLLERLPAGNPV